MLYIYAAVAEKERVLISQRTKAALAAKRARGEPLGNLESLAKAAPLGHKRIVDRADAFAVNARPILDSLGGLSANSKASIARYRTKWR